MAPPSQLELATHNVAQTFSFGRAYDTGPDMEIGNLLRISRVFSKLTSLTLFFRIQGADFDGFAQYLAILCPNVRKMEITDLRKISGNGALCVLGDIVTFISKFFGYRDQRENIAFRAGATLI
ncbi:hypothetical protein FRB94_003144 [Tulasnella sp. JGI-2019a]|nr:hypothetical protein FRB94_003144 [Tulasnella sp. JGI-2019a]